MTEFHIAYTCQNKGDHQEAIRHYNKSIKLNPINAAAYNNRGNAKVALGQYQEAIADYNAVLRINPQYAPAYNSREIAKEKLQQASLAE